MIIMTGATVYNNSAIKAADESIPTTSAMTVDGFRAFDGENA